MKKTEKVNIGGFAFHLDEDAYQYMKKYLDALEKKFGTGKEGVEIVSDIEARIAELLQDAIKGKKESVSLEDVKKVIEVMGTPEDFPEEEAGHDSSEGEEYQWSSTPIRRLYRNPDDAILGGVCGGLGAYFHADPILFRVLFVILLFVYGITGIIYLVLWIVVPPARTPSQKLEMRGESVTVDSIERTIRQEYSEVKDRFTRGGKDSVWNRTTRAIGEIFHFILVALKAILRVVVILVGGALILAGLSVFFVFLGAFFVQKPLISGAFDDARFRLTDLITVFLPGTDPVLLVAMLLLVFGIPLLVMMYWGLKILFRFKAQDRPLGIAAFIVWLFSLFLLVMIGVSEGQQYNSHESVENQTHLDSLGAGTITLGLDKNAIDQVKKSTIYMEKDQFGLYYSKGQKQFWGKPELRILKSDDRQTTLEIQRESQGKNMREAAANAAKIVYKWQVQDGTIMLDPLYTLPAGSNWRGAQIDIRLYLPEGRKIYIPESVENILNYTETEEHEHPWEMGGKLWKMTKDGLTEVKEDSGTTGH